MNLSLKAGVSPMGIRPELLLGVMVAAGVYSERGYECVVTSLVDGKHSQTSLHYAGCASDLRTYHVPEGDRAEIVAEIKQRLGKHYDVLLEDDHIHLEFQPRG